MKADMLQHSKIFETEINMYTKTLPKIEEILKECDESTKMAPELVYYSLQPRKVLIFEDLCVSGYHTIQKRYPTEHEVHMIYRKVAKLHAASFILGQGVDHEYVTKYQDNDLLNSFSMSTDFMSSGIPKLLEILCEHEELKMYCEKIKALQPEILKTCKSLYRAYTLNSSIKELFVLNHGDLHLKNLMFKFNAENQAADVLMVDYQMCCYARLSIDMIYSQYMMMPQEFRLRRNEFMRYHFTEFIRIVQKINNAVELPHYADFQMANLKYRHFSVFLLATFLPLGHIMHSATETELTNLNIADFFDNFQNVSNLYNENTNYIEELRQLLPSLLIEGYLD